jgi:hypothetical protein
VIRILLLVCALGVAASSGLPAPMRFGPHCVRAASLIVSGAPLAQLPPPGNPGHVEPPPGQTCAREARTPADHRCDCHRECQEGAPGPDGKPVIHVQEDPMCRVYCFAKSCRCPVSGCE